MVIAKVDADLKRRQVHIRKSKSLASERTLDLTSESCEVLGRRMRVFFCELCASSHFGGDLMPHSRVAAVGEPENYRSQLNPSAETIKTLTHSGLPNLEPRVDGFARQGQDSKGTLLRARNGSFRMNRPSASMPKANLRDLNAAVARMATLLAGASPSRSSMKRSCGSTHPGEPIGRARKRCV
jgi:hypothetical protein